MSRPSETDRGASFEDLFRRTRLDLLAYLMRRTPNAEEAADLLAETYLIAWRRLEAIPPGEQARLWLFGVARNLLKRRASRGRTANVLVQRLAVELRAAEQSSPAASDDRVDAILGGLSRLGAQDREILTLTAWEGLTPAEIAGVMGMSANRACVSAFTGRARN